jgi:hypothetical protein
MLLVYFLLQQNSDSCKSRQNEIIKPHVPIIRFDNHKLIYVFIHFFLQRRKYETHTKYHITSTINSLIWARHTYYRYMPVHACNPSTQETKVGGLRVQGKPGLHK